MTLGSAFKGTAMGSTGNTLLNFGSSVGSGALSGSAFGPWGTAIGAGIGAISSLASGIMQDSSNSEQSELDYQRQKEFAQNQIQWRVADAKKAGINPLVAIGGSSASYSPTFTSGGLADSVASAGASIQQGFSQYAQQELMRQQLERGALENDLLRKENQQSGIRSAKMAEDLVSSINGLQGQILGMNISKDKLRDNALEGMQDGYLKIIAALMEDAPNGKKSDFLRSIAGSAPIYIDKNADTSFMKNIKSWNKTWKNSLKSGNVFTGMKNRDSYGRSK
ncbi:MAG: DNA pilot protein [Microviridae sp.]|nr:MAG: DNA pilot protein [Microviridae sp.]